MMSASAVVAGRDFGADTDLMADLDFVFLGIARFLLKWGEDYAPLVRSAARNDLRHGHRLRRRPRIVALHRRRLGGFRAFFLPTLWRGGLIGPGALVEAGEDPAAV